MIKFIIPLLLIAFSVKAQGISVNETEPETGARTIITKSFPGSEVVPDDTVVKLGLVFFSAGFREIKKVDKITEIYFVELNIVHKDNRLGCMNQGQGKIILDLEDGTSIECTQISESDCDPIGFETAFALMPKGGKAATMKENFEKLKSVAVKKINIFTSEKKLEFSVKSKSKADIQGRFTLLAKTIAN